MIHNHEVRGSIPRLATTNQKALTNKFVGAFFYDIYLRVMSHLFRFIKKSDKLILIECKPSCSILPTREMPLYCYRFHSENTYICRKQPSQIIILFQLIAILSI